MCYRDTNTPMQKPLTDEHKKELLAALMASSKDQQLMDAVLSDLLSPVEYRELANRWQVIKGLAKGSSQRQIMKALKIGIGTVTRGAKVLDNKNGGVNRLLSKALRKSV